MHMWIALFSQTGSEIYNISTLLDKEPDLIITNRTNLKGISPLFLMKMYNKIVFIPNKPSVEDYLKVIPEGNHVITLHGYLRIIPPEICDKYTIYNLHPGLITDYPELKGFNPQEKAYNLRLPYSGAVIHKVVSEVDSGQILSSVKVSIKDLSLEEVYNSLHKASTKLWVSFLKPLI